MEKPVIYHGTPLTPRAALLDVCKGRAMCVSFFRPDDVEAVEAISPAIMFRQRRILNVEGGAAQRRAMVRKVGLVGLLRLAGTAPVSSWAMGRDPGYAGCAEPAQRCTASAMAVRTEGRAALAHGWANRKAIAALREVRPGLPRMDRRGEALGPTRVSRPHGGGGSGFGEPLASNSHDARDRGGINVSLCRGGRNDTSAKWMAI